MKRLSGILAVSVVFLFLTGCISSTTEKVPQPGPKQIVFKSCGEAAAAMIDATKRNDTDALLGIFGDKGMDIIFSGDPAEDKKHRDKFALDAAEKMSISSVDDKNFIVVGKKDWKFPVPIVSNGTGWFFETADGMEALLNRRIGMNEISTIKNCRDFVKAQREFSYMESADVNVPVFAAKITGDKGKKSGLYWENDGNSPSPLGPLLAAAAADQADKSMTTPYNGYLYKVLLAQGESAPGGKLKYSTVDESAPGGKSDRITGGGMTRGFALIAYPVKYGETGILTFIVSHHGTIYGKNLGEKTPEMVSSINEYSVDDTWTPASGE